MTAGDEQDTALEGYMIRWNRHRRESGHVLGASELLALGDLLRELDEVLRDNGIEDCPAWDGYAWEEQGIRGQLEKLLGMHPGSLDTSRDV